MDKDKLDELYYTFQHQLALGNLRALLYINGGACIALLTFIPHLSAGDLRGALPFAIGSLVAFCLGVAVAAWAHHVMYRTSVAFQEQDDPNEKRTPQQWRRLSFRMQAAAVILFLLGTGIMGAGFLFAMV